MSTFMGFAAVDLEPGADPQALLDAITAATRAPTRIRGLRPTSVWIAGDRVSLWATGGNAWLDIILARAAATAPVRRMILGLDHDEYGAEHLILAGTPGGLRRLQHVYVYPFGEPGEDYPPTLQDVPALDGVEVRADGTVDGPAAWAAVAAAYGVPVTRVAATRRHAERAHEFRYQLYTQFAPWWQAVGVPYPVDGVPADRTLF